MAKSFKVKLKKSLIGQTKSQRETVRCLGLRKIGQEVELADNPANRGQIYKVHHLVEVTVQN